ncbi:MAG TPA: NFACT family protein, partial [Candidatus Wallbacteria bacterium]|nr:NFACT family protein [Candidatus Wallbacteria bacterium]
MSFDSLSLKILLLETKEQIIGRTVDKIMEHRSGEYGFILRNESGPSILLVSINPNFPAFFHTLEQKINFMNTQSNYQLLMKKYFEGARIVDVKTFHSDRILGLYLLKKDSFSET